MADNSISLEPQAFRDLPQKTASKESVTLEKSPQKTSEAEKLKQACDSFEALFMQQMLKQMRATVPKDGMFGGGSAERIYTDMLDAELSKEMSAKGGLGISRLLFEHMMAAKKMHADIKD
jgi:flagellar protein FlgJ